ncbi:DNA gyrase inhibitor YacG [Allochromatium palmeri]|uniref:DNA gyrase inhibitor YacG n=1 Tax=Allochromatium palmeri TaxID=231048 RepID=A0A6N8EAB1_9GAMM|nr:DNA gyrase inhibitor YacG [Allochromatium palmeri]MTW19497.1 DNA gyrase inhibitor YacG [Allochromatium palmeri]
MVKTVDCPHCGKPVSWTPDSRWRPFCSERCRLIDLGDWLEERHRLAADDEAPVEDGPDSMAAPIQH